MRKLRKLRWVSVTMLSLVVMLCQKKGDPTPTVPKNQPGHAHRGLPSQRNRGGGSH